MVAALHLRPGGLLQPKCKSHMKTQITGRSIIGFERGSESTRTFRAFDTRNGQQIGPDFYSASFDELNRAAEIADEARIPFGNTSGRERARFLSAVADNIEELGDA